VVVVCVVVCVVVAVPVTSGGGGISISISISISRNVWIALGNQVNTSLPEKSLVRILIGSPLVQWLNSPGRARAAAAAAAAVEDLVGRRRPDVVDGQGVGFGLVVVGGRPRTGVAREEEAGACSCEHDQVGAVSLSPLDDGNRGRFEWGVGQGAGTVDPPKALEAAVSNADRGSGGGRVGHSARYGFAVRLGGLGDLNLADKLDGVFVIVIVIIIVFVFVLSADAVADVVRGENRLAQRKEDGALVVNLELGDGLHIGHSEEGPSHCFHHGGNQRVGKPAASVFDLSALSLSPGKDVLGEQGGCKGGGERGVGGVAL